MAKWKVDYDYWDDDEPSSKYWFVTNTLIRFIAESKENAEWLCDELNGEN